MVYRAGTFIRIIYSYSMCARGLGQQTYIKIPGYAKCDKNANANADREAQVAYTNFVDPQIAVVGSALLVVQLVIVCSFHYVVV